MKINVGRIQWYIALVLAIVFLVLSTGVVKSQSTLNPNFEINQFHTTQTPLSIESDADLISLNLEGSGTIDDPFLLQNYDISSSTTDLIVVTGITLFLNIQHNILDGVSNGVNGIVLDDVDNVQILNNTIFQTNIGIQLSSSSNNIIGSNLISGNSGYAIEMNDISNQNLIVWNNIMGNTLATSNAYDDGLQNIFQNNYWEVQPKHDDDDDQINDNPFNIDGDVNNRDLTPLINKFDLLVHQHSKIQLLQPNPSELRKGQVKIYWTPSIDSNGHTMKYSLFYSNDSKESWTLIEDQLNINYFNWNVSGLEGGQYYLKIEAFDELDLLTIYVFDSGFYVEEFGPDYEDTADGPNRLQASLQGTGNIFPLLFIILFVILGGYQIMKRISDKAFSTKILEGLLGITATPVLLQIISGDEGTLEDYEIIPPELLKFKYLLNPVRLGIMKILFDYTQIVSSELRDLIGISWGKFTPHIDSLVDKGMISSSSDFVDGKPRKILYLEDKGRYQFMELQGILRKIAN